jgi:hypothetical protein
MNNAMTDGDQIDLLRLAQPSAGFKYRRLKVRYFVRCKCLVDQRRPVASRRAHAGPLADAIDLPSDQAIEILRSVDGEDLKFEARRARIDDEDRLHGAYSAGVATTRRRASA